MNSGGPTQAEILQAEAGARELTVIGRRVLGGRLVEGDGLRMIGPWPRPRGPANSRRGASAFGLSVPSAIWAKMAAAVFGSCRKRKRDPAGGEMLVDAPVVLRAASPRRSLRDRRASACRSSRSRTRMRRTSHHWSGSTTSLGIVRRGQHQLGGFLGLVVLAQPLRRGQKCIRHRCARRPARH